MSLPRLIRSGSESASLYLTEDRRFAIMGNRRLRSYADRLRFGPGKARKSSRWGVMVCHGSARAASDRMLLQAAGVVDLGELKMICNDDKHFPFATRREAIEALAIIAYSD